MEEKLRCVSQRMRGHSRKKGLPSPAHQAAGQWALGMGPGRGPEELLTPPFLLQTDPRCHLSGLDCGAQLWPPSSGPPGCLPVQPSPPLDKWLCLIALCVCLGEGQYWGPATPTERPPMPLGTLEPSFTLALPGGGRESGARILSPDPPFIPDPAQPPLSLYGGPLRSRQRDK